MGQLHKKILFKVPSGCGRALKTKRTLSYSFNLMLKLEFSPGYGEKKHEHDRRKNNASILRLEKKARFIISSHKRFRSVN